MPLGVPEVRAEQRLRALRVRLLDLRRGSRAAAPSPRPRSRRAAPASSTIRARPLTRNVSLTPGIRKSSAIRSSSSRFVSVSASLFPGRSGRSSVRSSRIRTKPAGSPRGETSSPPSGRPVATTTNGDRSTNCRVSGLSRSAIFFRTSSVGSPPSTSRSSRSRPSREPRRTLLAHGRDTLAHVRPGHVEELELERGVEDRARPAAATR